MFKNIRQFKAGWKILDVKSIKMKQNTAFFFKWYSNVHVIKKRTNIRNKQVEKVFGTISRH